MLLAEVSLLDTVDLGELDALVLESRSSLLVLGGESLAVAAPGSEDWMIAAVSGVLDAGAGGGGVERWRDQERCSSRQKTAEGETYTQPGRGHWS